MFCILLSASGGSVCVGTERRDDSDSTIKRWVESSSIFWKFENKVEKRVDVAAGSVEGKIKQEEKRLEIGSKERKWGWEAKREGEKRREEKGREKK